MLINRDNYETIFLMYVDNELSAADRFIVEEFLAANEDLREEMEVLHSAVLPDEDLVFVPKTRLYKNATPVESVQESLLLLLDNELTGTSKDILVKQINENPQIKEEWNILQKTILDTNKAVVFEDKKSLYRHTERVIPMRFWRAAAAVLVGLGIFTGITLFNDNKVSKTIAVETKPVLKAGVKPTENAVTKPVIESKDLLATDEKVNQPGKDNSNTTVPVLKDKIFIANKGIVKKPDVIVSENEDSQKQVINLVKQDNMTDRETILPRSSNNDIVVNESPVQEELTNSIMNDSDVGKTKNSFARLAVNEEDPDRFLNIEEDKITRSKLGGLFRQVKRVVERNTKIKTSNGLRIGGFEIALK